jgi:hypothetical protein
MESLPALQNAESNVASVAATHVLHVFYGHPLRIIFFQRFPDVPTVYRKNLIELLQIFVAHERPFGKQAAACVAMVASLLLCPLVASRIKLVRTSALGSHGSAQVGATPNAAADCIAIVGPE